MYNFIYENQGVNTYLVHKIEVAELIDTLSLGMLTNNNIPGLAKTLFTQMDNNKYIKYNVSAKVSMKQFFGGVVNRKRLLGAFGGIVDGLTSAEDYMIDASSIILDTEYIFIDVSTCAATQVCLPIINVEKIRPDLGAFFKNIMVNTQFDQTENSDHVAKIFNFLNGSPVFSLSDFKKLLDGLTNEVIRPKIQPTVNQPKQSSKPQTLIRPAPPVSSHSKAAPVATPIQPKAKPTPDVQPIAPTKNAVAAPPPVSANSNINEKPEKKISLFDLLTHYNKENKALYDKQKAAKKAGDAVSAKQPISQQNKQPTKNPNFAVPGTNQKPSVPSFAAPGKPTPSTQQAAKAKPPAQLSPNKSNAVFQSVAARQVRNMTRTPPIVPQVQFVNFGETTVLGNDHIGATTVLNGSMQQTQAITPHLIRNKNNEKIPLDKPMFKIGKEKSYVDYFVSDNTAISRSHANVIERDGKYYIVDTNSTNHTFVNGKVIQSNVEIEIYHGDKIRLGNEDFEFKLY